MEAPGSDWMEGYAASDKQRLVDVVIGARAQPRPQRSLPSDRKAKTRSRLLLLMQVPLDLSEYQIIDNRAWRSLSEKRVYGLINSERPESQQVLRHLFSVNLGHERDPPFIKDT